MACRHSRGLEQVGIGVKIENPNIDYSKMAQSMGVYAEGPITNPKDVGPALKRAVRPGGTIVMSARNYLDPEFDEYRATEKMIEPGTFLFKEDCCRFIYFLEKDRLREAFDDFEVLYYYEGYAPCKYNEHPRHGDSYIICRRKSGQA